MNRRDFALGPGTPSLPIPVLTYHAMNVSGNSYETNDHVALAADLDLLATLGIRVQPLMRVVDALLIDELDSLGRCVALTFDDGSNFDFLDLPHPTWGLQPAMFSIMESAILGGSDRELEATSFVVVSPAARDELDRGCMIGQKWWTDEWWIAAEKSGRLKIESHSWDHNHECLVRSACRAPRGTFDLPTQVDADNEIAGANRYLCERRGRGGPVLFAYPYGRANAFLAEEYFPRGESVHGIRAAFTTEGAPVERGVDRWRIPRFVCGWHWQSSAELDSLLRACWP